MVLRRIAGACVLALLVVFTGAPAGASTPESDAVTVPAKDGQTVEVSWTGIVPPGANTDSQCTDAPIADEHTIELRVPSGTYKAVNVAARFTIQGAGVADLILTVIGPGGTTASSDGTSVGASKESVTMANPAAGTYRVVACAFAGAVDSYTGTLDLVASYIGVCPPDTVAGIDVQTATIPELDAAMDDGTLTSRALVEAYLHRIAMYDGKVDSIRVLNPNALAEADALDAERLLSGPRGPLHGIPVLLKDNVGTTEMPTTAGSIALEGSIPLHEAFLTKRLRDAGAIILGKTNLSEFANWVDPDMPSGYSSLGGQVHNAYHFGDPSGSSSGSGVAASMAFAAATIGTETSGSILSPSIANSDVGIKTTVGLVSRAGIIPLAPTFDTPGPITRTVTDAAIVLGAITGVDPRDPKTSESGGKFPSDYRPYLRADGMHGARIGVSDAERDGLGEAAQKLFDAAIAKMQALGATIVHTDELTNTRDVGLLELGAIPNEFKASLNEYLAEETSPNLRVRTMTDIVLYNNEHPDKMKYGQRYIIASDATPGIMDEPSAIAVRTATITGARAVIDDTMTTNGLDAIFAPGPSNANIGAAAQYPTIAVPAGYVGKDQPFGITLLGRPYSEPSLIKFAYAFERATHRRMRPTAINKGLCPRAAAARPEVRGVSHRRPTGSAALPATGTERTGALGVILLLVASGLVVRFRRASV
ncbi:MAG: hypothetical protein LC750_06680 [Actinobacteria bacterium]|nr:hypothetical protein [Actinomycetota bacterium]